MLCGMVLALTKVRESPFLMVTLSEENRRPFWVIVRFAANAPAVRPARTTIERESSLRMAYSCGFSVDRFSEAELASCWIEVARQSLEERDQIRFLLRAEIQWLHQIGTARPVDASLIVVLDHLLESGDRSIVHVRRPLCEFAQAGCLVGVLHLRNIGKKLSPAWMLVRQADVVESIVCEVPAFVARRALALGVEQRETALGFFGNRFFVPLDPGIEGSSFGHHGALVGCDRLADSGPGHPLIGEGRREQRLVFRDRRKPLKQRVHLDVHHSGKLNR